MAREYRPKGEGEGIWALKLVSPTRGFTAGSQYCAEAIQGRPWCTHSLAYPAPCTMHREHTLHLSLLPVHVAQLCELLPKPRGECLMLLGRGTGSEAGGPCL